MGRGKVIVETDGRGFRWTAWRNGRPLASGTGVRDERRAHDLGQAALRRDRRSAK